MYTSTAVIEGGQAMLVMGGQYARYPFQVLSSTQIVTPGQTTKPGPEMTEWIYGHCSTTLIDGSVIVTGGGRQTNPGGSATVEVYNFRSMQWTQVGDMNQKRARHSCTQVWLNPIDLGDGVLSHNNANAVLSLVVAGGLLVYNINSKYQN